MKLIRPALVTIAVTLFSYTGAFAQGRPAQETTAASGVVVDEAGAPVSGAVISVRHLSETMAQVRSAADGSFTIDVPQQSFDGVLLLASNESGDRLGTLVHPDQGRGVDEPVKIVLRKAAKAEVRVTDAQGQFVTGARVAASYRQQPLAEQMTDEAGLATLRVPVGVKLQLFAVQPETGFDYAHPTFESDDSLSLVLRGMVNVRVKVVDQQEQPIEGAKAHPMLVGRRNEPMYAISVQTIPEFQAITDKSGVAVCRIPIDNIQHVPIEVEAEGYVRLPRIYWIPDEKVTGVRMGTQHSGRTVWGEEFTVDLKPSFPIRGSVVHADGRPAAGARIGAFGQGYGNTSDVQGATADADGAFQIALSPDTYYVFNVEAGIERCRDQKRVIVAGRAIEPLKLVLQPARRIHGTLTGADNAPIPNQRVSLLWRDDESHGELPPEEQLPNPKNDTAAIKLGIYTYGRTDQLGRFEFLVAPGRYYVVAPDKMNEALSARGAVPNLPLADVTDQAEVKIDLH